MVGQVLVYLVPRLLLRLQVALIRCPERESLACPRSLQADDHVDPREPQQKNKLGLLLSDSSVELHTFDLFEVGDVFVLPHPLPLQLHNLKVTSPVQSLLEV